MGDDEERRGVAPLSPSLSLRESPRVESESLTVAATQDTEPFQMSESRSTSIDSFESLCTALGRNDPSITSVIDIFGRPAGKGVALGAALLRNTQVTCLKLHVGIERNAQGNIDPNEIEVLLSYLRHSESLRTFQLDTSVSFQNYNVDLWIHSIVDNQHIQEFVLKADLCVSFPSQTLLWFLQATKTLNRLSIPVPLDFNLSRHFQAMEAIPSLEALELHGINVVNPHETAAWIGSIPCANRLQSLGLSFFLAPVGAELYPIIKAVASYVGHSSSLVDFSIEGATFNKKGMECFLEGLQISKSLSKLALDWCFYEDDALDAFTTYMQTINRVNDNGLKALRVQGPRFTEQHVAWLMAGPRGSGLESVEVASMQGFNWNSLTSIYKCQSRELVHIKVVEMFPGECNAFARHLAHFVHFRTIEFWYRNPVPRPNCERLVRAARRNGSLQSIVARRCEGNSPQDLSLWTPREARLIEAYEMRNRQLPQLLSKKNVSADSTEHTDEGNASLTVASTALSLFPALFCASGDTPRMTLHHVFTGVLTGHESIGYSTTRRSSIRLGSFD